MTTDDAAINVLLSQNIIEIIENCINAFAVECSIDHFFLSPGIWYLFNADGNLHKAMLLASIIADNS
jgi:hypothetical protein